MDSPLYVETPLLLSSHLSRLMSDDVDNVDVYLKMENCQPTGSFKMRGVSYHAMKAVSSGCKHLVTSSGGNAGLALARSARLLGQKCTVFVPLTTAEFTVKKLQDDQAIVVRAGANYSEASKLAVAESEKPGAAFMSPYDHPEVWTGNATLVAEMKTQLAGLKPGVVVVSVGGAGLMCGVLEGLDDAGWSDVPVVAMETIGAHCFNLSVKANKIVPLEEITSIAVTLGARTVTPQAMKMLTNHDIISEVVSDREALTTCLRFADDHRLLVEPSCGAALSAVYCGTLRRLAAEGRISISKERPVAVVVCGGSGVSITQLQAWAKKLDVDFPRGAK